MVHHPAPRVENIVDAIQFIRDSIDPSLTHLALGSDWDGMVAVPFDASDLAQLTHVLLPRNFTRAEIRRVMGENAIEFLKDALPTRSFAIPGNRGGPAGGPARVRTKPR